MTVENRNKWNDFHYENFEAVASYKNQDLNNSSLAPFLVGHKNSFVLTPSFEGQRLVALSNDEVSNFRNSTVFDIVLKLYFKYWTKIGAVKINKELQMACYFKVPLSSGGKSAEKFDSTKCDKA
ncbi:PREDICTED: protein YLS9-like [Prunus mume]|uniref:Protein YLS9-like n=1 Tax=Prunus mume TaxID=102107 RepID=A0ABM0PLQ3_PRUMU|nr:PREDICTED: protein YLS9-like [Prunus mume]